MVMATFQVTFFHHLSRCSHRHPQLPRSIFLYIHSPLQPPLVVYCASFLSSPIDLILSPLQIPPLYPHHLLGLRCVHPITWRTFASALFPAILTPSWISSFTAWRAMWFMKDWSCWSNSLAQDYMTPTSIVKLQKSWQTDSLKKALFFCCDCT